MLKMMPYESNDFTTLTFSSRENWLNARVGSIGGSDAACVIDANPYKSKEQYLEEFKQFKVIEIKDNNAMMNGRLLEEHLREIFRIDYASKYELYYKPNTLLFSKENEHLSYSPDGLLIEKKTKRKGIWECKTTLIKNETQMFNWENQIPTQYFIQCIHGLIVTNFDFVILTAKLRVYNKQKKTYHNIIKDYFIERKEKEEDIKYLKYNELSFLSNVYE